MFKHQGYPTMDKDEVRASNLNKLKIQTCVHTDIYVFNIYYVLYIIHMYLLHIAHNFIV